MKVKVPAVEDTLQSRSFDSLAIKRIGRECYLVITIAGVTHVVTDKTGRHMTFRHAWQIRDWLKQRFEIESETIPVEIYR